MDLELGSTIRIVIADSSVQHIGDSNFIFLTIKLLDETGLVSFNKLRMREYKDGLVNVDENWGMVLNAELIIGGNNTVSPLLLLTSLLVYGNDEHDVEIPIANQIVISMSPNPVKFRIKLTGRYISPSADIPTREVLSAYTRWLSCDGSHIDFPGGQRHETHRIVDVPSELPLYVLEDTRNYGFFGILWPAENALCSYIWRNRHDSFRDKSILELGCCTGVAGIAAAMHGRAKRVVLTDQREILGLTRRNIEENIDSLELLSEGALFEFELCEHVWGTEKALVSDSGSVIDMEFDYIIAGDVLYDPAYYGK